MCPHSFVSSNCCLCCFESLFIEVLISIAAAVFLRNLSCEGGRAKVGYKLKLGLKKDEKDAF